MGDGIPFRLTLSLSPPLLSMLQDPLLQGRTLRYLNKSIQLAEREIERTRGLVALNDLAKMYYERLSRARRLFLDYDCDLVRAFRKYQEAGTVEIITSAATHALLPAFASSPRIIKTQVAVGLKEYERAFGKMPRGFWLPECGYMEGLEGILHEFGIRYFFLESHGILHGRPHPRLGTFAPIRCPTGIYAFGRDTASSRQVWCGRSGYPGHPDYRDFYRDVGFDLDLKNVRAFIQPDGKRKFTGIKYFRVTGRPEKEIYQRRNALEQTVLHAADFLQCRETQIMKVHELTGGKPLITSMFDAELFGHWWFEGPEWLDHLLRKSPSDFSSMSWVTPSEYLDSSREAQEVTPAPSSWGEGGYFKVWLNHKNDWIYKDLYVAADRLRDLASRRKDCSGVAERALNQAGRELLLAQSSDWAFILTKGTAVEYAEKRVRGHLENFRRLCHGVEAGDISHPWMESVEARNNVFADLDFRIFS